MSKALHLMIAYLSLISFSSMGQADEAFVIIENRSSHTSASYTVKRGDTLSSIVHAHFGTVSNLQEIFQSIVARNPHAFAQSDPNQLIAGQTLFLEHSSSSGSRHDDIYFF